MPTVTLSMRLPRQEAGRLAQLAIDLDMERSSFLKRALKRGAADLMFEHACQAYRNGDVTLSRAAEMAGLPLRDLLQRLHEAGLELNYDGSELQKDLRA
ncbi:MAG: UPF0175 family protein [bacterium]